MQLTQGGAAGVVSLTFPGLPAGSGQTYPALGGLRIYDGSTLLLSATSSSALPLTQNGLTLSAITTGGGDAYTTSLTLAAASSVAVSSGLMVLSNIAGPGGNTRSDPTSGTFDVVAATLTTDPTVAPSGRILRPHSQSW